jgi:hypothetical protein
MASWKGRAPGISKTSKEHPSKYQVHNGGRTVKVLSFLDILVSKRTKIYTHISTSMWSLNTIWHKKGQCKLQLSCVQEPSAMLKVLMEKLST